MDNYPTIETIRAVWARVTMHPNASVRALAAELGCGYTVVSCAIRALRAAGYIEEDVGRVRTRRVLVGFVANDLRVSEPGWRH